jgi:peroxiredoxin Q/BCP
VLGVSYDSPEANRRFAAANHLPFLLLSDRERALARAVGAAIPLLPVPKRVSVLVGDDGRVLKTYPSVEPESHAAEVMADFRAFGAAGAG